MDTLCNLCGTAISPTLGLPFCNVCRGALNAMPPSVRCQIISRAQQSAAIVDAANAMKRLSDDLREMVDVSRQGEPPDFA